MAKIGKHKISVENPIDHREKIGVEVEINVSKDGDFYFSLNEAQMKMLLDKGVDFSQACNKRTKKLGTFYAKSLDELKENFKKMLEEAISGEVLEDGKVILYDIRTYCSYCVSEGVPVPNGYYIQEDEKNDNGYADWHEGTDRSEGDSFGFNAYAQIYHKQVVKFKSGKVKTFYWSMNYDQSKQLGEYGRRLNHFSLKAFDIRDAYGDGGHSMWSMDGKMEIDYTEENAKFFHDILVGICKLNEQIKDFIKKPELLQQVINSQTKFLQ